MELIKIAEQFIDSKLDELKSEDVRKKIVDKWNDDINIPIIGEKTEEKMPDEYWNRLKNFIFLFELVIGDNAEISKCFS